MKSLLAKQLTGILKKEQFNKIIAIGLIGSGCYKHLDKISDIDLVFYVKKIEVESLSEVSEVLEKIKKKYNKKIGLTILEQKEIEYAENHRILITEGKSASYANTLKNMQMVYGKRILNRKIKYKEDPYTSYINYNRSLHDLIKEITKGSPNNKKVKKIMEKLIKIYLGNNLEKIETRNFEKQILKEVPYLRKHKEIFHNTEITNKKFRKNLLKIATKYKYELLEKLIESNSKDNYIRPKRLSNKTTVIFISGVNTAGKSTVARKLAGILNYNLIHLDTIKYPLKSKYKMLEVDTIDAYKEIPVIKNLNIDQEYKSLYGYKIVCNLLIEELKPILKEYVRKGKSVIIEGVHLDPESIEILEKECLKDVRTIKIMLKINTSESKQNLKALKKENDKKRNFNEFKNKLDVNRKTNIWKIYNKIEREGLDRGWIKVKNRPGYLKETIDKTLKKILNETDF